MFNLTL